MQRFVLACLIAAAMTSALAARVNKADKLPSPTLQLTVRLTGTPTGCQTR